MYLLFQLTLLTGLVGGGALLLTGGGRVLSSLLAFVDNGVGRLLLTGDDSSTSSLVSTDPSVGVALPLLGDGDALH